MEDRIKFSEEALEYLQQSLGNVNGKVAAAASCLKNLQMSEEAGAGHYVSIGSQRLSGAAGMSGIPSSGQAASLISQFGGSLSAYGDYVAQLHTRLKQVQDQMTSMELKLCEDHSPNVEGMAEILHYSSDTSTWTDDMWQKYYEKMGNSVVLTDSEGNKLVLVDNNAYLFDSSGQLQSSREESGSLFDKSVTERVKLPRGFAESSFSTGLAGSYKEKDSLPFWEDKTKEFWDEDLEKELSEKDVKQLDRDQTILEFSIEAKNRLGILDETYAYEDDGLSAKLNMAVGVVEANASFAGGIYAYKVTKDGKVSRVFAPGISAEIGTSVTGLKVSGDLKQELWGGVASVGVKGNVTVGELSTKASAEVGFTSEGLSAHVSGSAEALLFKAEAQGSIGLGDAVEIKGTAGVTVGVGAHFDAGYHDGVLSLDIGASLGIGVSGKVEVDVGGAVDWVVDKATGMLDDVGNAVSDGLEKARKFFMPWW